MIIREISIHEVLENEKLQKEHWDEIARNKHIMILNPDNERYGKLEDAGLLLSLGAFDNESLVGYSINFITTNLHYKELTYLDNDVLFLSKKYRVGRNGIRLIKETEKKAKEHGARMCLWHAKKNTTLEKILPKMGYNIQDIIFSKEL